MASKKPAPTIGQVATMAKVSKTTISRYINGRYEYMSDSTRSRIEEVIEQLEYRPNNMARGLKSNQSRLIGAVVADITSPFSSILLKAIGDRCKEKSYQCVIADSDNDPERERHNILSLIDNRVDGLIVNTTGYNDEFLVSVNETQVPVVLADRTINESKIDYVGNNNAEMTTSVVKYLRNAGFQHLALFTEEIGSNSSRKLRRDIFLDVCQSEFNVDAHEFVYVIDAADSRTTTEAIKNFMAKTKGAARAAFASNGVALLQVTRSSIELGLEIPGDLGICGYDDWEWTSLIKPGITAIAQPTYDVGVECAKRLFTRIKDRRKLKPKALELPSVLIERGSTVLK